jgi:hypothetical protein
MFLSNINHFNGIKWFPNWNEMYKILVNKDFPKDDEDLAVYHNIKKSELYVIATRPDIMPYNDAVRWIFSHLELSTTSIVNEVGTPITLIQPDNIH